MAIENGSFQGELFSIACRNESYAIAGVMLDIMRVAIQNGYHDQQQIGVALCVLAGRPAPKSDLQRERMQKLTLRLIEQVDAHMKDEIVKKAVEDAAASGNTTCLAILLQHNTNNLASISPGRVATSLELAAKKNCGEAVLVENSRRFGTDLGSMPGS